MIKTKYYQYQKPKLHEDTIQSSSGRTYTKSEVKLIILQQELYHKDVHIKQKFVEKHSIQEIQIAKENAVQSFNVLKQQHHELEIHNYDVQASINRLENLLNMHD